MPIDILKTLLQVDASIAQLATNVLELGPKNRSAVAAKGKLHSLSGLGIIRTASSETSWMSKY